MRNNHGIILRSRPSGQFRQTSEDSDSIVILDGHPTVWDSLSEPMWDFVEVFRKGAFTKTLQEAPNICAFNSHLRQQVLACTAGGTLLLREDDIGLHSEIHVESKITYAMDLIHSIRRKDVTQQSIGFWPVKWRWTYNEDEPDLCEILEAGLFDISPVALPQYLDTSVGERQRHIDGIMRRAALGDARVADEFDKILRHLREAEPESIHSSEPAGAHSSEPGEPDHSYDPDMLLRQIAIRERETVRI